MADTMSNYAWNEIAKQLKRIADHLCGPEEEQTFTAPVRRRLTEQPVAEGDHVLYSGEHEGDDIE